MQEATMTEDGIEIIDPGPPPEGEEAGLDVLNIGAGDLEFRFRADNPEDVERAKKTIEDMLRRGYTILVNVGGKPRKVKKFDPRKELYIIQDLPADPAPGEPAVPANKRVKAVPMRAAQATGIAPVAGG